MNRNASIEKEWWWGGCCFFADCVSVPAHTLSPVTKSLLSFKMIYNLHGLLTMAKCLWQIRHRYSKARMEWAFIYKFLFICSTVYLWWNKNELILMLLALPLFHNLMLLFVLLLPFVPPLLVDAYFWTGIMFYMADKYDKHSSTVKQFLVSIVVYMDIFRSKISKLICINWMIVEIMKL